MLAIHSRIKHVVSFKRDDILDCINAVVHVHHGIHGIHYGEDLLPIIDMPDVRLIGPMQTNADA
jgi:hypothetical protein